MNTERTKVHFTDNYLINPTNPLTVNLIGAGGTGSRVVSKLMAMNHSLIALGHPGLQVRVWDNDIVTEANLGRQDFAQSEVGLYKSVALVNRANRWTGMGWKAETQKFERDSLGRLPDHARATIFLTCVDKVQARFEVAEILKRFATGNSNYQCPKYWLDFGNGKHTGQVILSTVGKIPQPNSERYEVVESLPFVTDEFADLLRHSEETDDTPSCSLAEALEAQDLFINSVLSNMGASLLWSIFRLGILETRGFFLNLSDFRCTPIPI